MIDSTHVRVLILLLIILCEFPSQAQEPPTPPPNQTIKQHDRLKVGHPAPDFILQDVEGQNPVTLSKLKGRPVVLTFGSCTCPVFVSTTRRKTVQQYEAYKDKAYFYIVYIREAHPLDGWAIPRNSFSVNTPHSMAERQAIARAFVQRLHTPIPVVVDTINDQVQQAYASFPNRTVIIDGAGNVAYKGKANPTGVASSAPQVAKVLDKLLKP